MTEKKVSSRTRRRRGLRIAGLLLLLGWLLLETVGFPQFVTNAVTNRLSRSKYLVQADGMRLDLLTGVYLDGVKVYRKKVVGPPAIECDGMRFRYNPFRRIISKDYFPTIEFIGGSITPAQSTGKEPGDGAELEGLHVILTDVVVEGIPFEHLSAEISATGFKVSVGDIVCSVGGDFGGGKASGWIVFEGDGSMAGRLTTRVDPHVLLPMLERIEWNYTCKLIRRFDWGDGQPLIDSTFTKKTLGDESEFSCTSLFTMRDFSYREVRGDTCDGLLSVNYSPTSGVVSVDHITVGIGDRVIVGGFSFDDFNDRLTYRTASDADPREFFALVGLFRREQLDYWSFPGVTRIISEGLVDFRKEDGDDTRVLAEVESSGMGIGWFVPGSLRFNVDMEGGVCRLNDIHGKIWDGEFVAHSQLQFSDDKDVATFGCMFDNCDFTKVVEGVFSESSDMKGKFYVEMNGSFPMSTNVLKGLTAKGRMSVDDGKVFQLALFGGLTRILSQVIPGLDFVIAQSDMTAEFEVKDGAISSEKVSIAGDVLSLQGNGSAGFNGDVDFAVQLKLMGENSVVAKLVRAVTWPISKLMEFRLKGTAGDIEWYPINFSSELLEKIGLKKADVPTE